MINIPARLPAFLWLCIKPQKRFAFAVIGTALLCAILRNLAGPYFFKCIVDIVAKMQGQAGMLQEIAPPAAIFLALLVSESVNFRLTDWLMLRLLPAVRQRAILMLAAHLKHHSSRMFQDNYAGSLSNKIFDVGNGAVSVLEKTDQALTGFASLLISVRDDTVRRGEGAAVAGLHRRSCASAADS